MKTKTHEEFIKQLQEVNPNIDILEPYTGRHNKIACRCIIDGYTWKATPNNLLYGKGCPECAKKTLHSIKKKTQDDFIKQMSDKYPNIEVIGEYYNYHTKILLRCKIDGYEWETFPSILLNKNKIVVCPKCAGNIKVRNNEDFVKNLSKINPYIEPIDEYVKSSKKIKVKCKKCDNEWYATPNKLLMGRGCRKCNNSLGENRINNFLIENNINFNSQHVFATCKDIRVLPFDFYLIDYNIAIEYDGRQHFEPVDFHNRDRSKTPEQEFVLTQKHDKIKTQYCIDNDIKLLRISYFDFDNIEEILIKELEL